jgi:hypothetical protein
MRIAIVLMIVLALWPGRAGAQDADIIWVSVDPDTFCQSESELPWYHPKRAGAAACQWTADLKAAVRSDWGYKTGAGLFILGNVITFSFPVWAALGADAYTVAAVIIVGEVIDVVGIYVMGEEAFQDLKDTMGDMADQWGDRIDRWRDQIHQWGGQINRLRPSSLEWS